MERRFSFAKREGIAGHEHVYYGVTLSNNWFPYPWCFTLAFYKYYLSIYFGKSSKNEKTNC